MAQNPPLISIITVTYQAAKTLVRTINSVATQVSVYEYIVIDGGSTDGTLDIIRSNQHMIGYWSSESDKGIYDAMNKGIAKATGQWVYFLGADDALRPDILKVMLPILSTSGSMLIYGDVKYDYGKYFRSEFSLLTILHNTIHHQASFYKRSLFSSFSYDASLKIIADYELNLIIYLQKIHHSRINQLIADCSGGGNSYNVELSLLETNAIRKKHVGTIVNFFLTKILKVKYLISYVLLRKI